MRRLRRAVAGVPLNAQELLNAIYSGTFVTAASVEYSNPRNANLQTWQSYVKGDPKRQGVLEVALGWTLLGFLRQDPCFSVRAATSMTTPTTSTTAKY